MIISHLHKCVRLKFLIAHSQKKGCLCNRFGLESFRLSHYSGTCQREGYISEQSAAEVDVLDAGKMGRCENLSDADNT